MTSQRARWVHHLYQPFKRQILMTIGRQVRSPNPAHSSRKLGSSDVSVRSTNVLTKNPTRSSSALSVRPAMGLPIGMSVPAPRRVNSAASPACSTMNKLARLSRASSSEHAVQFALDVSATLSPRWLATAGRGRSVGSSSCREDPERLGQNESCRAMRAPRIPLRAQHLMLPQRVVGILHRQRRKSGARPAAAPHRPPPDRATAAPATSRPRNVVQQQQQHVLALAQAQTNAPAAAARSARSKPCPAAAVSAPASSASTTVLDCQPRPRRGRLQYQLAGTPSRLGKHRAQALMPLHHVAQRRLQSSASSAPSAAPPSGCCRSRSGPPGGAGTTAAAAQTTAGSRRAAARGTQRRSRRLRPHAAAAPAPPLSAPQTACGSQPRHPACCGCG